MAKINLAINSGSTSLKVLMISEENEISAKWEKAFSQITFKEKEEKHVVKVQEDLESSTAFVWIINYFQKKGIIKSLSDIEKVGYRVVHGGYVFREPTKVEKDVIEKMKTIDKLSIAHNPITRRTVEEGVKLLPEATHVLYFDTTFHKTIPMHANMYGISMKYYDAGIRKFGFHGISVEYVAKKTAEILKKDFSDFSGIVCHLGGGCSITAIKDGKSVDSTMGYTPVDGLVMSQRSGSVDPTIVKAIMDYEKCDIDEAIKILSNESGFKGICGVSDYRKLKEKAMNNDVEGMLARKALNLFIYQIQKQIGALSTTLNNINAIVFTGGIGENDSELIYNILDTNAFKRMGIIMDKTDRKAGYLTYKKSIIPVLQVPTNEERAILEFLKEF